MSTIHKRTICPCGADSIRVTRKFKDLGDSWASIYSCPLNTCTHMTYIIIKWFGKLFERDSLKMLGSVHTGNKNNINKLFE